MSLRASYQIQSQIQIVSPFLRFKQVQTTNAIRSDPGPLGRADRDRWHTSNDLRPDTRYPYCTVE
jgi:hypothetical protein